MPTQIFAVPIASSLIKISSCSKTSRTVFLLLTHLPLIEKLRFSDQDASGGRFDRVFEDKEILSTSIYVYHNPCTNFFHMLQPEVCGSDARCTYHKMGSYKRNNLGSSRRRCFFLIARVIVYVSNTVCNWPDRGTQV